MKYLIIDKKQRVKLTKKYPYAVQRLMEELDKKEIPYDFAYSDQIAISIHNNTTIITANEENITQYTHILLRGHHLHQPRAYSIKRIIVDHIETHNQSHPKNTIRVQNSHTIKLIPYYDKIYTMLLFIKNGLPYFDSYYRTDGDYKSQQGNIKFPLIIKNYSGANDIRMIDGERKVKKNVYKVENSKGFEQEHLRDKNFDDFYIQQFSNQPEDIRIFVANGKVIGGWRRKATSGFMTVLRGKYEMYNDPSIELREIAEKTARVLQADFIAVDFMFQNNKPYIQEISLHPGFKAYETKIPGEPVNVARIIVESFS